MKTCPSCNAVMDDSTLFCTSCGTKIDAAPAQQAPVNPAPAYQPPANGDPGYAPQGNPAPFTPAPGANFVADPTDHTAEFAPEDVSANKPFAMLVYIGGIVGLLIALFLKKESAYLDFHIRQAVKIYLTEVLSSTLCALLSCLVLPMIALPIIIIILLVVRIICFFNVAKGLSKEPAIVKSLDFLK